MAVKSASKSKPKEEINNAPKEPSEIETEDEKEIETEDETEIETEDEEEEDETPSDDGIRDDIAKLKDDQKWQREKLEKLEGDQANLGATIRTGFERLDTSNQKLRAEIRRGKMKTHPNPKPDLNPADPNPADPNPPDPNPPHPNSRNPNPLSADEGAQKDRGIKPPAAKRRFI